MGPPSSVGRGSRSVRGKFISVEGGEGSGKSTQVARLVAALEKQGIAVLRTREPGGTAGGDEIRRLLVEGGIGRWRAKSELLLHFAARIEHVSQLIQPALDAGKWVVSDRFVDSTMAYQGYGHRLGREWVALVHHFAVESMNPDLTMILDLDVAEGLRRARSRAAPGEDRYERMDAGFHARVREGFLAIAETDSGRCVLIDAASDVETVAASVWLAVAQRFGFA
ncbi:MAG: dTMP kinase [Alphaproteobacteria bacterium]|nr:dTMP kinase [Alphaproteobacteria bacterium]